jgi:hypothetical protein
MDGATSRLAEADDFRSYAFTPDGDHVLYEAPATSGWVLRRISTAGGEAAILATGVTSWVFSPGGEHVAVAAAGKPLLVRLEDAVSTTLANAANAAMIRFSPRGDKSLWFEGEPPGILRVARLIEGDVITLSSNAHRRAIFSPDGASALYVSDLQTFPDTPTMGALRLARISEGTTTLLGTNVAPESFRLSPAGERAFYLADPVWVRSEISGVLTTAPTTGGPAVEIAPGGLALRRLPGREAPRPPLGLRRDLRPPRRHRRRGRRTAPDPRGDHELRAVSGWHASALQEPAERPLVGARRRRRAGASRHGDRRPRDLARR